MYDFLLMNSSNYGPISHRFGDAAMYRLKIAPILPTPVGFNAPARGGK